LQERSISYRYAEENSSEQGGRHGSAITSGIRREPGPTNTLVVATDSNFGVFNIHTSNKITSIVKSPSSW
jgi:hypothetical protein